MYRKPQLLLIREDTFSAASLAWIPPRGDWRGYMSGESKSTRRNCCQLCQGMWNFFILFTRCCGWHDRLSMGEGARARRVYRLW